MNSKLNFKTVIIPVLSGVLVTLTQLQDHVPTDAKAAISIALMIINFFVNAYKK